MRRISLALPALLLDVLPVAAFAGVGYLLGPVVAAGDTGQTVLLIVIEAGVIFGGALCFARLLVAPNAPGLRLIPMTDASAHAVLRWVGWLAGIAVFGLAPLDIALLLGLDAAAHLALAKLVLLIDHVLLVVVILRNRRAVAAHLRAPKRLDGMLPRVLSGLADVWHIFAIVLVMGMWLIWAVGWQTGYTRLLQFVGLAIAIGVVTRLVIEILLAGLRHLLRVPDKSGGAAAPGGAGARAARYYVLIGMGITFAVRVVGLVVLLQLSGADALGWLFGNTLGRQAISALISVAVFLSAAGFVNATIIHMPRSFYAMAQDGVLPRAFLRVNPDTQVQQVGLLFFGATMLVPAFLLGSFEKLLDYVIFTDTLTLAVVASTLFVLRRRHAAEGAYTMIGYPLLPAIYVLCLLGAAARVFTLEPHLALSGIVVLATGWPLFRLGRRLFNRPR